MTGDERIPIPRLANRGATRWYVGGCVVGLTVVGYLAITQPENRPWIVLPILAIAGPVAMGLSQKHWLEPRSGTFGYEHLWLWRRTATLSPELPVSLVDGGNGVLQLCLGSPPGRVFVPLLRLSQYDHSSQPPEVLRLVAEQLARHTAGRKDVADRLTRQADHVAADRPLEESPLAVLLASRNAMPLPGRVRHHD
jgi:hypothetical protein